MANTSALDAAFAQLQRAAVESGDADALKWSLHPGSRSRGVPWLIVIPEGKVRSITLADSRQEAERTLYAMTRLFENYSTVKP